MAGSATEPDWKRILINYPSRQYGHQSFQWDFLFWNLTPTFLHLKPLIRNNLVGGQRQLDNTLENFLPKSDRVKHAHVIWNVV